ncbi:MAG TPA: cytochrome c oxidase subunit II [Steroidobacteraceae bacterium]
MTLLPSASANASEVDRLLWALLAISLAVLVLVFALLLRYITRYRANSPVDRGVEGTKSWIFESAWTGATLLVFLGLFVWGANLYVRMFNPPQDALRIYVVAKQWMWKVEHPSGQREINALHVPLNRAVQLIMTSEDVIHDFSVPAFRIKHDVLPGRYETLGFTATRAGTYPLYCTQFCGVNHSMMTGEVVVLPPAQFAAWLARNPVADDLVGEGRTLYIRYGCSGCHARGAEVATVRAPPLEGLYGRPVPLSDGRTVTADERYLHDSIVAPGAQIVAGYQDLMPSYAGQISEEDLLKLVTYIKSLSPESPP